MAFYFHASSLGSTKCGLKRLVWLVLQKKHLMGGHYLTGNFASDSRAARKLSKCLPIEEKVCCLAIQLGDPVPFLIVTPPHFFCFGVNECREIMTLIEGRTSMMDDWSEVVYWRSWWLNRGRASSQNLIAVNVSIQFHTNPQIGVQLVTG